MPKISTKLAIIAALAAAFAASANPARAENCSRSSLKDMIADYFKAVDTQDMSALPTAANVRITENGVIMQPGTGFFQSGGAVLLERDLVDSQRCGTVSEVVSDETVNGQQTMAVMAVRLKVVHGKVTEIEQLVTREADVAMPCNRWEGGLHTTRTGNCSPKGLVATHTLRRFPVTDLELGETAVFVNFVRALPDVHIFKFNDEGQVYLINAVFGGRVKGPTWPASKSTAMK